MKKLYILISLMFIAASGFAQTSNWLWAKSAGKMSMDGAYSVAVDSSGNTYVAGAFRSPIITFGSFTLINNDITGQSTDLFLAKYDANGNVLWAKSAGGVDYDEAFSVAVDAIGNIYIAGYSGSFTFGLSILTGGVFLAKFDLNGNALWAKCAVGGGTSEAWSVALDETGNAFLTGYFESKTITFGSYTLTNADSTNTADFFLVKYNSSGNVLWAKSASGKNTEQPYSITTDASGNTYITGSFNSSTLRFDSVNIINVDTTGNSTDLFFVKYDSSGNVLWVKSAGGIGDDGGTSVAADILGNIYITGRFMSPAFIFDSDTLINTGWEDLFIAKCDTNGNIFWIKSATGSQDDWPTSVAVDNLGNAYLAGWYTSPVLSFGINTLTNVSFGLNSDIFLAKYDINGIALWAKSAGGINSDKATSIAVDSSGNIFLTGYFASPSLIFSPYTLTNADSTGSTYDVFLAKFGIGTGINEWNNPKSISIFPNPATENLSIETPEKATIEILNIQGQIIKTINTADKQTSIDVSNLSSGVYIIKAKTDRGVAVKKFIKE